MKIEGFTADGLDHADRMELLETLGLRMVRGQKSSLQGRRRGGCSGEFRWPGRPSGGCAVGEVARENAERWVISRQDRIASCLDCRPVWIAVLFGLRFGLRKE